MAPLEDRISNLPDEIICHILSFIPTKHAVITGVLSKRWKHLWRSIPLLDFPDIKLKGSQSFLRFNQFVYYIAASNHSINSFILHIHYPDHNLVKSLSIPILTTWVNLVVQRKVKYFHLLLHSDVHNYDLHLLVGHRHRAPKLPTSIFTCKTLVVLNLSWFNVEDFSFSSVGFEFPLLKTLHLNHINFDDEREFLLLLAGCPVLEDFKAHYVFTFHGRTEHQVFHSLSLNKLIRADMIGVNCEFPMKALSNSEFLKIQLWEMYTPYDYPTFNNLTHLVINYYLDMFLKVLYHCPKLQNLELYQKTQTDWDLHIEGDERESWEHPTSAPQCLSLYLKNCTIRDFGFVNLQHDIFLARYILTNATVLQTITIWSDKEQPEIQRELSSCPRASATCQLSVY